MKMVAATDLLGPAFCERSIDTDYSIIAVLTRTIDHQLVRFWRYIALKLKNVQAWLGAYGRHPAVALDRHMYIGISVVENRRPTPMTHNTSQYKVLLYLPPFDRNFNVKLCHPIRSPLSGRLQWFSYGVEGSTAN